MNQAEHKTTTPSRWIVPVILMILALLIIVAALTAGPVSNHGSGPAHKDGVPQYQPMQR